MTPEIRQTIHDHAFLFGLDSEHLEILAQLASHVTFDENDVILVDGQHSRSFYLLTTGSVAVELRTPGFVVCVQALGPGDVFGWSSLLNDQDTLFQVRAREKDRSVAHRRAGAETRMPAGSAPCGRDSGAHLAGGGHAGEGDGDPFRRDVRHPGLSLRGNIRGRLRVWTLREVR